MSNLALAIWIAIGCMTLIVLLRILTYGRFVPKSRRATIGLLLMALICIALIIEGSILTVNPVKYRNIGVLAGITTPFIFIVDGWMVVRQNYPFSRPLLIVLTIVMSISFIAIAASIVMGSI